MVSIQDIPPEILQGIIEFVEAEDLENFVLTCKWFYQNSTNRLHENAEDRRSCAVIEIDLKDDTFATRNLEALIQPRNAFHARSVVFHGYPTPMKDFSRLKVYLSTCDWKSLLSIWNMAINMHCVQLMLLIVLRLAPRVEIIHLNEDPGPYRGCNCNGFHELKKLWAGISESIRPQRCIREIKFGHCCIDDDYLSSLLKFMNPLEKFTWTYGNSCHPSLYLLHQHSGNSLRHLSYLGKIMTPEVIKQFSNLETIELSAVQSALPWPSLAKYLPTSIQRIHLHDLSPDEPDILPTLFNGFELTHFTNLHRISIDSLFFSSDWFGVEYGPGEIAETKKFMQPFIESLIKSNPQINAVNHDETERSLSTTRIATGLSQPELVVKVTWRLFESFEE